jgi:hypothetical protein
MQSTVRIISHQADDLARRKINVANDNSYFRLRLAGLRPSFDGTRLYDTRGIDDLSNLDRINRMYEISDASTQSLRYRNQGQEAAYQSRASANNLLRLLSEPATLGSPKLRALGTNLYVRNYGEFDYDDVAPADPLLELRATALKLPSKPEKSIKGQNLKTGKS